MTKGASDVPEAARGGACVVAITAAHTVCAAILWKCTALKIAGVPAFATFIGQDGGMGMVGRAAAVPTEAVEQDVVPRAVATEVVVLAVATMEEVARVGAA